MTMEIVETHSAFLSNYEVLEHVKKARDNIVKLKKNAKTDYENTNTILYEVNQYLSKSSCVTQTPSIVQRFLETTQTWGITKAEKLMMLNLRPESAVELWAILEDADERFGNPKLSEEEHQELLGSKLNEMLESLNEIFGSNGEDVDGEGNGGMQVDGA